MKKYKNAIISTLIFLAGLILSGVLAYFYDIIKNPAFALWTGATLIILFWINLFAYFWFIITKPFKK